VFFFSFFLSIQFCDVAEVAIVHNISDLARFGYILDIKLELEKKRIHKSKIFVFLQKKIFFEFFFSKFQLKKKSI